MPSNAPKGELPIAPLLDFLDALERDYPDRPPVVVFWVADPSRFKDLGDEAVAAVGERPLGVTVTLGKRAVFNCGFHRDYVRHIGLDGLFQALERDVRQLTEAANDADSPVDTESTKPC